MAKRILLRMNHRDAGLVENAIGKAGFAGSRFVQVDEIASIEGDRTVAVLAG